MKTKKINITGTITVAFLLLTQITVSCSKDGSEEPITSATKEVQSILEGFEFAEGPAFYNGTLYFSDIDAGRICSWNAPDGLKTFRENSGRANGLYFGSNGTMYICEGGNKRISSIDQAMNYKVIADSFAGKPFNEPNDLWVSPKGDIYFTDPVYTGTLTQPGQYVYCLHASTGEVSRVIEDFVKPNGIVGTMDGTLLYVADWGASKIYRYSISADGSLGNKVLFAGIQADGLDIDSQGNLYAAGSSLMKYGSSGELLETIAIQGTLTNICVVENGARVIYATTHSQVFKITGY